MVLGASLEATPTGDEATPTGDFASRQLPMRESKGRPLVVGKFDTEDDAFDLRRKRPEIFGRFHAY